MKVLKLLFTLIITLSCLQVKAQINSPVAGDVITLLELLTKDYSVVSQDILDETLRKDRAEVIGIFKKYLETDNLNTFSEVEDGLDFSNIKACKDEIVSLHNKINTTKSLLKSPDSNDITAITNDEDTINEKRDIIAEEYYSMDSKRFEKLIVVYKGSNPYVTQLIENFKDKYEKIHDSKADIYVSLTNDASTQKSLPFFGGELDLETLIDGLSRFIADRLKAEISNAFIEKIKKWLVEGEDLSFQVFETLLPKTNAYLKSLDIDDLNYFSSSIKQFIEEDLNTLIDNVGELQNIPEIHDLINENAEIKFAFIAAEFIPQIKKIKHPNDFFQSLYNLSIVSQWNDPEEKMDEYNTANAVKLLALVSSTLLVSENNEIRYINQSEVSKYFNNPNFYLGMIGLLAQQNKKFYKIVIKADNGGNILNTEFSTLLSNVMTNIPPDQIIQKTDQIKHIFQSISNISTEAQKINDQFVLLKKYSKSGKEIGKDTIIRFLRGMLSFTEAVGENTFSIIDTLAEIGKLSDKLDKEFKTKLDKYLSLGNVTVDILEDLCNKRYSNAILKGLEIPKVIYPKDSLKFHEIGLWLSQIEENEDIKIVLDNLSTQRESPDIKSKKMKKGAKALKKHLYKISIDSKKYYPKNTVLIQGVDLLLKKCIEVTENASITVSNSDITDIQNLIKEDVFQLLLVNNIFNLSILPKYGEIMEAHLNNVTINGQPAFTPAQIANMKNLANDLVSATFKYAFSGDITDFKDVKNRSKTLLQQYVLALPHKFNFDIHPNVLRIVHLLNDLAQAKDAEMVQASIEKFAMPVGSYRLKQSSGCDISLNSFPGVLFTFKESSRDSSNVGIGFTAPVGISLSRGYKGWSFGAYFPFMDIGAFTHYRLKSEENEESFPDINFRNIFAFGAYGFVGIKGSPLTIYGGWQAGPQIRKIEEGGIVKNVDSSRLSLGLTIDIPIFTLYNSRR